MSSSVASQVLTKSGIFQSKLSGGPLYNFNAKIIFQFTEQRKLGTLCREMCSE